MSDPYDDENQVPPETTHRIPPSDPTAPRHPRSGAPVGPPPPADAFRPGAPVHPGGAPGAGGARRNGPEEPPTRYTAPAPSYGSGPGAAPRESSGPHGRPGEYEAASPYDAGTYDSPPQFGGAAEYGSASRAAADPGFSGSRAAQPYGTDQPYRGEERHRHGDAGAHVPGSDPASARRQESPEAAPRRRKRWPKILVIVLAFLVVLFVIGDRVGVRIAESEMKKRIELAIAEQSEPGTPPPTVRDVSLGGFPFLTQVLFGNYKDIQFGLEGVSTPGPRVQQVTARLQGVRVPLGDAIRDDIGQVPVDEVEGTVVVSYDDLNAYLAEETAEDTFRNVQVKPVGNGERVEATATIGLSDLALGPVRIPGLGDQTVRGVASFNVTDGTLNLSLEEIGVEGTFDASFGIPAFDSISVPTPSLPLDLRIVEAGTNATGLSLTVRANDVVLPAG